MFYRPTAGGYAKVPSTTSGLNILAGWEYLLSGDYRRKTNERWRNQKPVYSAIEIAGGSLGIALSVLMVWGAGMMLSSVI